MLATSYPILDVFVSTLYFVLLLFWIILVFHIVYDIFRSHDLSGVAKTLWIVLILIMPLIGSLIYVLVRGARCTTATCEAPRCIRRPSRTTFARSRTRRSSSLPVAPIGDF